MYTLEEYNRIQNDLDYQKKIINDSYFNLLKMHNLSEELQLYFLDKHHHSFKFIKFPTEGVCLRAMIHRMNIQYIDNPTEEMCWKGIKSNFKIITYIDIIKYPKIFKFYQKKYKGYEEYKFTLERFKRVNYDLDYQKENYKSIRFNQIIKPSSEIINFFIDKKEEIDKIAHCYRLTEEQQSKILDLDSKNFRYFKYPSEEIIYKAINLRPNNIKYVDLDKYPELYNYWRLLNI